VPVQPALILKISAMLLAFNKKPHLSELPYLYEMVDLGKDGDKKERNKHFSIFAVKSKLRESSINRTFRCLPSSYPATYFKYFNLHRTNLSRSLIFPNFESAEFSSEKKEKF
jgi:hypothetical protein